MEDVERKKIYVIGPLVLNQNTLPMSQAMRTVFDRIAAEHGVDILDPYIQTGPSSIMNEVDDALCIPPTLRLALRAKAEGAHGILVNCMCDPGVKALRTLLDIPVVGPAETAFHLAASLGHKFSIVDVGDDTGPMVEAQVHDYGLSSKFASIRGTGVNVEEIGDQNTTFNAMGAAALAAVREDKADVIVLGCTGFTGCAEAVKGHLEQNNVRGVPVIDPLPLAIRTLIGIVLEGHCHSKKAFPTPVKDLENTANNTTLVGAAGDDPLLAFYNAPVIDQDD